MKKKDGLFFRIIMGYVMIAVLGIGVFMYAQIETGDRVKETKQHIESYSTTIQDGGDLSTGASELYNFVVSEHKEAERLSLIIGYGLIAYIIFTVIVSIFIAKRATSPIIILKKKISEAQKKNDLTTQFSVKTHDEIGEMANALNGFIRTLRASLFEVSDRSTQMATSMNAVNESMGHLNEYIKEISDKTEDISAGMQETAASTEEVNATIEEINSAVQNIADKSKEGADTAQEIKQRASELKSNFTESQRQADTIFTEVKTNLEKALEESKEVEQINTLASSILEITRQTNLLSLNASIEAARAGEAGRGFAIVADEIGKLAENSAATANQIQKVSEIVMNSVRNLAENANDILHYVSTNVQDDYRTMLAATTDYSKDALNIEEMVSEFSSTTQQLLASIENITSVISQVDISTNEGAEGTTAINSKAVEIESEAKKVESETDNAVENAKMLVEAMEKFMI